MPPVTLAHEFWPEKSSVAPLDKLFMSIDQIFIGCDPLAKYIMPVWRSISIDRETKIPVETPPMVDGMVYSVVNVPEAVSFLIVLPAFIHRLPLYIRPSALLAVPCALTLVAVTAAFAMCVNERERSKETRITGARPRVIEGDFTCLDYAPNHIHPKRAKSTILAKSETKAEIWGYKAPVCHAWG